MSLVKSGQIANCCAPNALMTLKEYLEDYAAPDTRAKGIQLIKKELEHIPNPKIKIHYDLHVPDLNERLQAL